MLTDPKLNESDKPGDIEMTVFSWACEEKRNRYSMLGYMAENAEMSKVVHP